MFFLIFCNGLMALFPMASCRHHRHSKAKNEDLYAKPCTDCVMTIIPLRQRTDAPRVGANCRLQKSPRDDRPSPAKRRAQGCTKRMTRRAGAEIENDLMDLCLPCLHQFGFVRYWARSGRRIDGRGWGLAVSAAGEPKLSAMFRWGGRPSRRRLFSSVKLVTLAPPPRSARGRSAENLSEALMQSDWRRCDVG